MKFAMTRVAHKGGIIALVFLVGACVRVGNIQKEEPVRTTKFTGSPKTFAQCVRQRLGGQLQEESFASRYVIFDSVKSAEREYGITHYSVTIAPAGDNEGVAALRVVTSKQDYGNVAGGRPSTQSLEDAMMQKFWTPVESCAAQVKAAPK
jgi:hypothetical protein